MNYLETLPLFFFLIALFYSMVGFGGGSSYIALLIIFGISYTQLPVIALICNLIVVTGGTFHFIKKGNFSLKLWWPFAITAIPMAFLGGRIHVEKDVFQFILAFCLLAVGLRMVIFKKMNFSSNGRTKMPNRLLALLIGTILGFISGMVGIGGGIFLNPILYTLKWGKPKQIAATSTVFIFANSIAGLFGQIQKTADFTFLSSFWILFFAVFFGGQIGSFLCNWKFSQEKVKFLTGILILFVSGRLLLIS